MSSESVRNPIRWRKGRSLKPTEPATFTGGWELGQFFGANIEHEAQDDPEGQGGADTTDESDSEERQYKRQRQEVVKTAQSVFADADEDYSSLRMVKGRLENWQRRHPEAFKSAYAAESAPAIFAPFVRNELLSWEPVFEDSKGKEYTLCYISDISDRSTPDRRDLN